MKIDNNFFKENKTALIIVGVIGVAYIGYRMYEKSKQNKVDIAQAVSVATIKPTSVTCACSTSTDSGIWNAIKNLNPFN